MGCAVILCTLRAGAQVSAPTADALLEDWSLVPPIVHDPGRYRPAFQRLLHARQPGMERLAAEHPGRRLVLWNEETCLPHRIAGAGIPLVREGGAPGDMTPDALVPLALDFVARHPQLFAVSRDDLRPQGWRRIADRVLLRFAQSFGGVPVLGAGCAFLCESDGTVVDITADLLPTAFLDASTAAAPDLDAGEAAEIASLHLGVEADTLSRPPDTRLWVVPARLPCGPKSPLPAPALYLPGSARTEFTACLAWEVRFPPLAGSVWSYFVAARSGRSVHAGALLGRLDRAARGTVRGAVQGNATPGVLPDHSENPPRRVPLAGLEIERDGESVVTDSDGSFALPVAGDDPLRLVLHLAGPHCVVENAEGRALTAERIVRPFPEDHWDVLFNPAPSEALTSQVNAFLWVNAAHDFVRRVAPEFTEVDTQVVARVNADDIACNAWFLPEGNGVLQFFKSDEDCANTAYSTWIVHEYGHFVVWKAFGDRPPMPAYTEGVADALAALVTGQPVIGEAFDGRVGGDPESIFSRDLSREVSRYPDDLLREPHEAGLMLGHAVWGLFERLRERYRDEETARDIAGRLLLASVLRAPAVISGEIVLDLLEADDDDGDLANGTPHAGEILDSFAAVGLHPPGELEIRHQPVGDVSALPAGPIDIVAEVSSIFEFLGAPEVTLRYSINGGATFRAVPLAAGEDGRVFRGAIPEPTAGTTVRYYLEAVAAPSLRTVLPEGAPSDSAFVFAVGDVREVYSTSAGDAFRAWRHETVENGFTDNEDDWQWGTIGEGTLDPGSLIDGNVVDPTVSFSGGPHWGNDLALDGRSDKLYSDRSSNVLESPGIDCRGFHGIHLRFRRWLSAERSDRLWISVNDTTVFQSATDRDTFDASWTLVDYDVSGLCDDRDGVVIRFGLESDGFGRAGGWNVDDLRFVATREDAITTPVVVGIVPQFDSVRGGASFFLRGRNFDPGDEPMPPIVSFGGIKAEGVSIVDDGAITGIVPPREAPGPVTIVLSHPRGFASLPGTFVYFGEPVIGSIAPTAADVAGGATVRVVGKYFTPDDTTVLIGGRPLGEARVFESEVVEGVVPPGGDAGPVDVSVTTRFGSVTVPGAFTYTAPPVVDAIDPTTTMVGRQPVFTISGRHFPTGASIEVLFGDATAQDVFAFDETTLVGRVPASEEPAVVDVTVVTPHGGTKAPGAFAYVANERREEFIRGDANLDDVLDISDAISVLGFLFIGTHTLTCRDAADINDDGVLDVSDPVALLSFLFRGGGPPPAPHPAAGPDPTADSLDCAAVR